MNKLFCNALKLVLMAEFFVILTTIYCFIGDIPFRTVKMLWADCFVVIVCWFTHELITAPTHNNTIE